MGVLPAETQSALHLLDALAKLENVAALYPPAHHRVVESGEHVRAAIDALTGAAASVHIECEDGRVHVQSVDLDPSLPTVRRFQADLDALAIATIEIDRRVSGDDLGAFARAWRNTVQGVARAKVSPLEPLGALPSSIRVDFRELGRRIAKRSLTAGTSATAETGDVTTATRGEPRCDPDEAMAHRWTERALQCVAERLAAPDPDAPSGTTALSNRSLDEVLQLAGDVLEHAIAHYLTYAAEGHDLGKLFESIQLATALSRDADSAVRLVDVLQRSAEQALEEEAAEAEAEIDLQAERTAGKNETYERTLDDLCADLDACLATGVTVDQIEQEDRCESISILFEMLIDPHDRSVTSRLLSRANAWLAAPLSRNERQTVQAALSSVCVRLDAGALDRVLPPLARALGEEHAHLWLAAAIEVARMSDVARLEALWPHLSNEILHGPRPKTALLFDKAVEEVARLPEDRLAGATLRLRALEALTTGRVDLHAFVPLREQLTPFYAALLAAPRGALVEGYLLLALRQRPPAWRGAEVLHCLRTTDPGCQEFLSRVFAVRDSDGVRALEVHAGRLLAKKLAKLPLDSAHEPWVAAAIGSLGKLRLREGEAALERVLSERKLLLLPAWPSACRSAARRALAEIRNEGTARVA